MELAAAHTAGRRRWSRRRADWFRVQLPAVQISRVRWRC